MMRYIYVGSVEVEQELALSLLQASDQYLLEGLKRLCETALGQVGWWGLLQLCTRLHTQAWQPACACVRTHAHTHTHKRVHACTDVHTQGL